MLSNYVKTLISFSIEKCDIIEIFDGEEDIRCNDLDPQQQAIDIIESVEEATLSLINIDPHSYDPEVVAQFFLVPDLPEAEAVSDYTDNELAKEILVLTNHFELKE